ncbi:MAG: aminotransferase class III-fold pyridoxal phosphate-dependent enzyme, partial [Muribaculaceae bacterium]|nr:aminotransferase class III-fold pyridoxal phosphate-dependent enzyme [Muribaculaceae bacterium]
VLDVMENENLVENAREVGEYLISELHKIPEVKDVRGKGLMIGLEVEGFTGSDLRKKLLFDHHIFTGGAGQYTVRLLPALSLSKEEADRFLTEFKKAVKK